MKFKTTIISLSILITVIGCSKNSTNPDEPGDFSKITFAKSTNVSRELSPDVSDSELEVLVSGNKQFSIDIYRGLSEKNIGNIFFSPHSISLALAMTYAGAEGETEQQMKDALNFNLEEVKVHTSFNALDLSLQDANDSDKNITLNVVNAIWGQTDWEFESGYLDILSKHYGAGLNLLDFMSEPEPSRIIINDWVSYQTNDRINDLLPPGSISSLTRLVLTNAIYFYGDWLYMFNKELTANRDFTLLDNSTVSAEMMSMDTDTLNLYFAQTDDYKVLELPYTGDRLSMVVFLAAKGTFEAFEQSLDSDRISVIIEGMQKTKMDEVQMPKFSFTTNSISIKQILIGLGMSIPFQSGKADFSGIDGTRDLFINDVVHKAFIAVDEEGTEAAAATAVIIGTTSVPTIMNTFIVDRPFIFLIRDKETGTILFMGRILDPTA